MTPRFRYPLFEENQVLSYQHLNQLTDFLEREDRLSRRALIGAGVAYGLAIEHSTSQGLRLRRGAALTTDGSLCHLEQDLLFVAARVYRDPVGYPPFHGGGGAEAAQTDLWELLEESSADTTTVASLSGAGAASFIADKAVLLYLEVTTADLDTCIDNHCINQGQERRGVWRVLLARRTYLTAVRQSALGTRVVGPAWALDELRAERLCLQSPDVLSHAALSTRGLDFVRQSRTRLLPAIRESVPLYGALLEATPQTTADALNALSAGFDAWLASMVSGNRVGWQHGLDHVRHIYRAWAEFVEAAFGFVTEPAPLREPFPQHVLLGVVPTPRYGEPDFLRHIFVPSPVLTLGGRDLELCRHRFLRLMTMAATFGVPASRGVRITPGAALDHVLDEEAVPFYYDPNALLGCWNADATWRDRGRLLPCYHRESLLNDPAVRDPLRFPSDTWEFYRIEGHQGRNCREVEQVLDGFRRQYHLAFDVMTVTFGPDEPETTNCLCELEELKTLYRVSAGEMRCHLSRLLGFLGGLAKPATAGTSVFDRIVLADGQVNVAFDLQKVQFVALGTTGFRASAAANTKAGSEATTSAVADVTAASGAANAAGAAVTAQTEDIRTVYLDNLKISYAVISSALYPFLAPEALVNSLARELMGRLTEADGRLGAEVEEFNADQFSQSIQAARAKASDLADALTGLSADVDPDVLKQRELLRQELLLFLANCVPTRIVQIATLFAAALERLRATPTLASFLRKHPGLEHLGGVPKGGTFVLVCGRPNADSTSTASQTIAAARAYAADAKSTFTDSVSESLLLKAYGYYQSSPSTNTLVDSLITGANLTAEDKVLLTENYTPATPGPGTAAIDLEAIYERLREFFGAQTGDEQDIVLADFCLPYLCCSECTCSTKVVLPPPPPATLTLPASSYCADDPGPYPFGVQPPGGVVTGPGVVSSGGGYAFSPAAVKAGEILNGRVTFTYKPSDASSATLSVAMVQPPALAVAAGPPTTTEGGRSVTFSNATPGPATFVWNFGDGSATSTDRAPTHTYTAPGTYTVTVTAISGPCTATATLEVRLLPSPTLSLPATEFCANDDRTYPVTLSPDGGTLVVNGIAVAERTFTPTRFPGTNSVALEYRIGDQSAKLTVALRQPPRVETTVRVGTPRDDVADVVFSAIGDDPAPAFTWHFPDGSTASGANVTHRFAPGVYTVTLVALRSPCTVSRTITFQVPARTPQPNLAFDPGRLDVVLTDGRVREVVGSQDADLIDSVGALNLRAAPALSDPATRERLDTRAAEKEIGSAAQALFARMARVLLEQAGAFSGDIRDRLWAFGQVPVAATLYLAGLRTKDLTATGEVVQAFSVLQEILEKLRRTAHGSGLAFNDELAALLEATAADAAKPVLQGLSQKTTSAFSRVRHQRTSAKKKNQLEPEKTEPKPAPRSAPKKPRRRG